MLLDDCMIAAIVGHFEGTEGVDWGQLQAEVDVKRGCTMHNSAPQGFQTEKSTVHSLIEADQPLWPATVPSSFTIPSLYHLAKL